jgi:hypothetical protein
MLFPLHDRARKEIWVAEKAAIVKQGIVVDDHVLHKAGEGGPAQRRSMD